MKIAVAGAGYVGVSNAVLLAKDNEVQVVDIVDERVKMINNRISPVVDAEIERYMAQKELRIHATTNGKEAYKEKDFIIIATPTDYDPKKNYFDTSSVESVVKQVLEVNSNATIVINDCSIKKMSLKPLKIRSSLVKSSIISAWKTVKSVQKPCTQEKTHV